MRSTSRIFRDPSLRLLPNPPIGRPKCPRKHSVVVEIFTGREHRDLSVDRTGILTEGGVSAASGSGREATAFPGLDDMVKVLDDWERGQ